MRTINCVYNGTTASLWFMDAGEKIARHVHQRPHTTMAVTGTSKVTIFDGREPFEMHANRSIEELPPFIDHEIEAMVDGTLVLNMAAGDYPSPRDGGVLMADGTVL